MHNNIIYPPLDGNGWKQPSPSSLVVDWDSDENSLTRAEFSSLSQSTTNELGLGVSVQWWIYNVGGSNDDIRSVLGVAIYQKRVRISSLLPPTLIILKYNTSQKKTRASWNRMRNLRGRLMKLCSKYLENMTLSMPPLKRMKTLILSLLVMHPWT